jgi:hypothetical protein
MTEEKTRRMRERAIREEKRVNEARLKHLNLLRSEANGENGELPAEFMPSPGNIPTKASTRAAFSHSDRGKF